VINLQFEIEKKREMELLTLDFKEHVEFVNAVYGKELSDHYINKVYNDDACRSEIGRGLTKGEVGCALSHLECMNRLLSSDDEYALILEDDIVFDFDPDYIKKIVAHFPKYWDIVLLGHHSRYCRFESGISSIWGRHPLLGKHKLVKFKERTVGGYGYIISRNGAHKWLEEYKVIFKPIDHWEPAKNINLYGVNPPIVNLPIKYLNSMSLLDIERTASDVVKCNKTRIYNFFKNMYIYFYKNLNRLLP